ncbi:MAG: glycosyltransferase [Acidimicrobiales bacterium]
MTDQEKAERYAAADLMAMPCNQRWGGLEQEGFGIVFLEAAAVGIPQIAGRSGGADEAVVDGVTGIVVDRPDEFDAVADAPPTRRRSRAPPSDGARRSPASRDQLRLPAAGRSPPPGDR